MKTIKLTQGQVALVDDEDFARISIFKWCATKGNHGCWYAVRRVYLGGGKKHERSKRVYMHQFILNCWTGVDHINGSGLDNQKHNLRPASQLQNMRGYRKKKSGATSQYRGVCKFKLSRTNPWVANLNTGGRTKYLGLFPSEIVAAKAYDAAAREHFGEFASLNFP